MPDLDAANVVAGQAKAGGVYIAPAGSTLPTDATTALDAAFKPAGYVSEDGVTLGQDLETEAINAWQSSSPIKNVVTSRIVSIEFTMIEINGTTLATYFGEQPPTPAAGEFSLTVSTDVTLPEYCVVVDLLDGDRSTRFVANRAQLSEAGDIEITRDAAVGLPVTLSTLDDSGVLMTVHGSTVTTP